MSCPALASTPLAERCGCFIPANSLEHALHAMTDDDDKGNELWCFDMLARAECMFWEAEENLRSGLFPVCSRGQARLQCS